MKLIAVAADYHQTPFGTWTAVLDALLGADDEDGLSANAAAATLAACQGRVLELVAELSKQTGRPCHTLHLLDGNETAFVRAYQAEVGFAGWTARAKESRSPARHIHQVVLVDEPANAPADGDSAAPCEGPP